MTAFRVIESSGSNGSIQFAENGEFSSSGNFVFVTGTERVGIGTDNPSAKLHVAGDTVFGSSSSDTHLFSGSATFSSGLTGSLQEVSPGVPFLVAGPNVSIQSNDNGSFTISADAGSGSGASYVYTTKMSWMETPVGDINGINDTYALLEAPKPEASLMLYVNGVLQSAGATKDYVLTDDVITLKLPLSSESVIAATYAYLYVPPVGSNTTWMEVPVGDTDGVNSTFRIGNTPRPLSALMLYYNGVLQRQGNAADYTILGGRTVMTNFLPESGSNMSATYPY